MDSNRPQKSNAHKGAAPASKNPVRSVQKPTAQQKKQNNVSGVGNGTGVRSLRIFEKGSVGELHKEVSPAEVKKPRIVLSVTARKWLKEDSPRESYSNPKPKGAATPRVPLSNKFIPYDGAELRPFQGRPGSMDAFDLPSKGLV